MPVEGLIVAPRAHQPQEFSLFAIRINAVQEFRQERDRAYYYKVLDLAIYLNHLLVSHMQNYFDTLYGAERNERPAIKTHFEERLERKFNKKALEICALIMDHRVRVYLNRD